MKAERSVVERRGYDSGDFYDGCRPEMGIQITLLHPVPIYMPLCHLQAAQGGGEEEERRAGEGSKQQGRREELLHCKEGRRQQRRGEVPGSELEVEEERR